MKKQLLAGLIGFAALLAVGVGETTAHADATVNIGGTTVSRSYLNIDTYYRATRAVKATVTYYQAKTEKRQYNRTITLPKGTVVAGRIIPKHQLAHGKWGNELALGQGNLNYKLLNSGAKKGYVAGGTVSYALTYLKKVKRPAYMPTYSYGDLYLGGAKATLQADNQQKRVFRVTTNGYVELIARDTKAAGDAIFAGKPLHQAKIKKTRVKGATRYLYLSTKMSGTGIKTTRVGKKGAYQYRLALKNLHKPQNLSYDDDDRGTVYVFDSLYAVGGVTYYTPICFGSEIED